MNLHGLLFRLFYVLLPVALVANTYLYLYPLFQGCAFAAPQIRNDTSPSVAPFRLLALGDPQLEGDTSLPRILHYQRFDPQRFASHLRDGNIWSAVEHLRDVLRDSKYVVPWYLEYARKSLDLVGNDYYLAHVYRTIHWYSKPTHVTVLGDLLGSQWIDDEEFGRRSWRFWNKVFKGSSFVPNEKLLPVAAEDGAESIHEEILGSDASWSKWIVNVPGNHDIGYAGDLDQDRVERFERKFGPVNGDIRFRLNETGPTLRLVVLNSMNMDAPQKSQELAGETIEAINRAISGSRPVEAHDEALILLTHIPLHKESGICVDPPMFSYFEDGTVREQNFLSYDTGRDAILQGLFGKHPLPTSYARGMGRDGVILTGHDHEGCDVYHYANRESGQWEAKRWTDVDTSALLSDADQPGIREVTVRSMMGEFGGNTALVSAWWDEASGRWKIEVRNCGFVVQHIWWAVHILDIIVVVNLVLAVLAYIWHKSRVSLDANTLSEVSSIKKNGRSSTSNRKAKAHENGKAEGQRRRKKPI
jgi:hypothetical protein